MAAIVEMSSEEEQVMEVDQGGAGAGAVNPPTEWIDFTGVKVDKDHLKEKGITREVVKNLLKVDGDKYINQLFLVQTNYNSKTKEDGSKARTKYNVIKKILFDDFRLYRLASNPGQRWTNSRGSYLCYVTGNKDQPTKQRDKIRNLCKKIKRQLLSDPDVNISKAHVVASLVIYYGDDEEEHEEEAEDDEDENIPPAAAAPMPQRV